MTRQEEIGPVSENQLVGLGHAFTGRAAEAYDLYKATIEHKQDFIRAVERENIRRHADVLNPDGSLKAAYRHLCVERRHGLNFFQKLSQWYGRTFRHGRAS